ncbi:hypothetical protein OG883_39115 [Streptomyces sp. NBC_01142]|uniref:hypothetical protein n=1 Tax=Streptomyces sp. NBC_01142 TaxID=2975865 RepID=UPI00224CE3DD|nr:hypothetical protein [Streptomyces sp. NBC_01142]MCX4825749.1 hypothetical protein [Streptomyces sp. NBC_01142]
MAIAVDVIGWGLWAWVIHPTGFEEMRHEMGLRGAKRQLATSAGALVVVNALWLGFALSMRAGRNWARIVLAVVGALSALWLLNSVSMSGIESSAIPEVIHDLLAICAAVLMFLPTSHSYFSTPAHTD